MARYNTTIYCTVVGFNFAYVTMALGIIGVLVYRRVNASPMAQTFDVLVLSNTDGTDWKYPFEFYLLASLIPPGVSVVACILAFLWTAVIRPNCCGHVRSVGCKESTSVLFVVLMVGYTALLFPAPLTGLSYSKKLENNSYVDQLHVDMQASVIREQYYKGGLAFPGNYTLTKFGKSLDYIQRDRDCCGIKDYSDYFQEPSFSSNHNVPMPYSCCPFYGNETFDFDQCQIILKERFPNAGCGKYITDTVKTRLNILNGAGFSAITICMISALLSVLLAIFNIWLQTTQERERKEAGYGGSKTRINRDDHVA